jgi:hypothetical protein
VLRILEPEPSHHGPQRTLGAIERVLHNGHHHVKAIAYRAIQNGYEARFTTAAQLIDDSRPRPAKGG